MGRKIPLDNQVTPRHVRSSIDRQRERYKAAGLVQINVWIPVENKAELMQDCARLRVAHLKHMGYWSAEDEG